MVSWGGDMPRKYLFERLGGVPFERMDKPQFIQGQGQFFPFGCCLNKCTILEHFCLLALVSAVTDLEAEPGRDEGC